MIRTFLYTIDKRHNGSTILSFLQEKNFSHAVIVQLKKTERGILKNGIWSYVRDRLAEGDLLELNLEETESSSNIPPIPLPLDILYEDDDILVVNKPAHMPVHPSLNHHEDALANAVMYYYNQQNIPYVFRCITRLDRDTTGVTLLAKNLYAAAILNQATLDHAIEKTYLAICEGIIPEYGTVEKPIARQAESAILRCVDFDRGDYAKTYYHRLQTITPERYYENVDPASEVSTNTEVNTSRSLSLVALQLETGRTHQIRVHMQSIGHPLIGDFLYHPEDHTMDRQALHCYKLAFQHPWSGERMEFSVPLPEDMYIFFPDS